MSLPEYFLNSKLSIEVTLGKMKDSCFKLGKSEICLIAELSASFDITGWAKKLSYIAPNQSLWAFDKIVVLENVNWNSQAIENGAEFGELILRYNYWSGTWLLHEIANSLELGMWLQKLSVERSNFLIENVRPLAKALKAKAQLLGLSLEFCTIGIEVVKILANVLPESDLEELDFNECGISIEGVRAIADALKAGAKLRRLRIRKNDIGNKGAELLAKALFFQHELEELDLMFCDIGAEGVGAIAEAIKAGANFTKLNLSGNYFGSDGAELIAGALRSKNKIQQLDLNDCVIWFRGAKALATALATAVPASKLKQLNLASNIIGNEGAEVLAKSLEFGAELQELDLRFNRIGQIGLEWFHKVIRAGVQLKKLGLTSNPLPQNLGIFDELKSLVSIH